MGYIYKITNRVNGKTYIGCSIDYKKRWQQHIALINKAGGCPALKAAILKHGLQNFNFQVLIVCFDDDMQFYEPEYIRKFNSIVPFGYNISPGGKATCGFKGRQHSAETKSKIGEHFKQKYKDVEFCKKQSENQKRVYREDPTYIERIKNGLHNSESFKESVIQRKNNGGFLKSEEHRNKISKAIRSKPVVFTEERNKLISDKLKQYYADNPIDIDRQREIMIKACGKPVIQFDLNGNIIAEFKSATEASRATGIPAVSIRAAIKANNISHKLFRWKFKELTIYTK